MAHPVTRLGVVGLIVLMTLFAVRPAEAGIVDDVQSGTVTLSGSSVTASITSVDLTKSFLVYGMRHSGDGPSKGLVSGEMTNATTLTFRRVGTSPSVTIYWYVAEFTSGVTVQRGIATASTTTFNVTISSVDLTKSFPLVNMYETGSIYGADDQVRGKLTSATNLQLTQTSTGSNNYVPWQVVEFDGATVQSGDVSFASGDVTKTATVTSVDTSASWLIFSQNGPDPASNDIGEFLIRSRITNATTLTFDRNNSGSTRDLTWYLIEFTDGTSVQHGSTNFGTADTLKNVTVSSVTTGESIATAGAWGWSGRSNYGANDIPGVGWFTLELSSATNLRMTRALTNSATADVGWYVVDFYKCAGTAFTLADHDNGQELDALTGSGSEVDAELFAFNIDPGGGSVTITELVFDITSITGLTDADWADLEIIVDDNDNGSIGATETTAVGGAGVVDQAAGTITFSTSITVSSATNYVLRADFASLSDTPGDAVTVSLTTSGITSTDCPTGSTTSVTHRELYVPCYTEMNELWSASSNDTWETKDLSGAPFNVPANAIVEIGVRNQDTGNRRYGGVRAYNSGLDRRLRLGRARDGGQTWIVMHVQTDASSRIEQYSDDTNDVRFVLLGYWQCGQYVEAMDQFAASGTNSWLDHNLAPYGVSPDQIAEIVIANDDPSDERDAGVRAKASSSLERRFDITRCKDGDGSDVVTGTMHVIADGTSNATIQVYAQNTSDVEFHHVGYWSTPPQPLYVETYSSIGDPASDGTWETKDLGGLGVPAGAFAEVAMRQEDTNEENEMGVRTDATSPARILDIKEAESGGQSLARVHVPVDTASSIQVYMQDSSDNHEFTLLGFWTFPYIALSDHDTGQETDAFTISGSETNAELFAFRLAASYGTISVTELVFGLSDVSGLGNGDFAGIEILEDTNGDGDIGVGETTAIGGTGVVDTVAGTITFSTAFNVTTTARNYILRADFAMLQELDTMTVQLLPGDVTASRSVTGSTTPVTHSEANFKADVMLIVVNGSSLNSDETAKRDKLEALGYRVVPMSASDSQAEYNVRASLYDAAYISETISSGDFTTKLKDATIGVVYEESALSDDFGVAQNNSGWTDDSIDITDNTHFITVPFDTGVTAITTSTQALRTATGTMGGGSVIATQDGSATAVLVALDIGDALFGGGTAVGRRVHMPWGGTGFDIDTLTSDGETVLRRAMQWVTGPASHWKFDDGSGATPDDTRGDNDGTLTGGSWTDGYHCGGLDFNGSSDLVTIAADASLNAQTDLTIAVWFKLDVTHTSASGTTQLIAESYLDGDHNMVIALVGTDYTQATVADGSLVFKIENTDVGGLRYKWTNKNSWNSGQWYHVIATIDRDSTVNNTIFIDGVDDTSSTDVNSSAVADLSYNQAIKFGGGDADQLPSSAYFNGVLDDARLYSRALTPKEALALYNGDRRYVLTWREDDPN